MSLGPRAEKTLVQLLADSCPSSISPYDSRVSIQILRHIFDSCDDVTRVGYKLLLFVLEWFPSLLTGHFSIGRFSQLSETSRRAHIDALRSSRFYVRRALFKAMLTPVWISHYTRTQVQLSLGYDSQNLTTLYQGNTTRD